LLGAFKALVKQHDESQTCDQKEEQERQQERHASKTVSSSELAMALLREPPEEMISVDTFTDWEEIKVRDSNRD
jgi:hypothetical protein